MLTCMLHQWNKHEIKAEYNISYKRIYIQKKIDWQIVGDYVKSSMGAEMTSPVESHNHEIKHELHEYNSNMNLDFRDCNLWVWKST